MFWTNMYPIAATKTFHWNSQNKIAPPWRRVLGQHAFHCSNICISWQPARRKRASMEARLRFADASRMHLWLKWVTSSLKRTSMDAPAGTGARFVQLYLQPISFISRTSFFKLFWLQYNGGLKLQHILVQCILSILLCFFFTSNGHHEIRCPSAP